MNRNEVLEGLEIIRDCFDINTKEHKTVVQEAIDLLRGKSDAGATVLCSDGLSSRATTFDELEKAFYDLVQKHNALVKVVQKLKQEADPIVGEQTRYGL